MKDDLRKALSAIDGVERSEVDLVDDGPLGIRVQLARDADRGVVADAVQRLLEAHGLRSRVAPDRRAPGPELPPAPPGEPRRPASSPGPTPGPAHVVGEPPVSQLPVPGGSGIEAVTVTETLAGVEVSVVADGGRTAVRRGRRTEQGLHEAIVAAVGELVDPQAPPVGLRGIEHSDAFPAMTVYLEGVDGLIRVGASVLAAGNPFAFAQAVWAALQP